MGRKPKLSESNEAIGRILMEPPQANKVVYPWDAWTKTGKDGYGQSFEVVQGKQFLCDRASFRNILYTRAKRDRLGVLTAIDMENPKILRFQFYNPKHPTIAKKRKIKLPTLDREILED